MDDPEPWMIEFVKWLARHNVQIKNGHGRMFVQADTKDMDEADLKVLAEFEQMVLARNN